MKYAIPITENKNWDSPVGEHFGRVPLYAIWDQETNTLDIIPNESNHFGGVGMPAEFLATKSNAIICSGIGARAIDLCNQLGLDLYIGATDTIRVTIDLLTSGKLTKASRKDGCDH
ncbi:MAG: NifB/NifX family molybdenum-iron cluster-binding protein [Candidatus Heimdallarchaeota archaeon]|nr:NifB/NifX family molybdenum-iron cluster-binding protein [Candidatus Heimdallarchaeota archaeon]